MTGLNIFASFFGGVFNSLSGGLSTGLDWIIYLLLVLACIAGLLLNLLGLPGIWLIVFGAIAHALYTGIGVGIGWSVIVALVVMGVLAEVIEFVAGAAGSKKAGGTKRGMVGAIVGGLVGGILGTPIFPIVGTIIGSIVGSFVGAFGVEALAGKTSGDSAKVGIGAAKGRALGILIKTAFGCAMAVLTLAAAFPLLQLQPATQPATTAQLHN